MRIRLLSNRGRSSKWRRDTQEETLVWARRLARYGVKWKEVRLPAYVDTLNLDPIFELRDCEELAVALDGIEISALTELASDFDLTVTVVPSIRWVWVEDGDPFTHSLIVSDEDEC